VPPLRQVQVVQLNLRRRSAFERVPVVENPAEVEVEVVGAGESRLVVGVVDASLVRSTGVVEGGSAFLRRERE
jgi:hypothetical protein